MEGDRNGKEELGETIRLGMETGGCGNMQIEGINQNLTDREEETSGSRIGRTGEIKKENRKKIT